MCHLQDYRRRLVRLTGLELEEETAEVLAAWLRDGTAEAEQTKELLWFEALARGRADLYLRALRRATADPASRPQ